MYDDLVYTINGGLFAVANTLGNIWPESVYEKALCKELLARGLKTEAQKEFEVRYFEKRVGLYRLDVLVEDQIIIELKAAPEVFPLHQAQLISYLKGYDKPLGILANFGSRELYYRAFPNKVSQKTVLTAEFDINKVNLPQKHKIRDVLLMAHRILVTLGPGYFHQVYRRALYWELQMAGAEFEPIREMTATYRGETIMTMPVRFLRVGDLLISALAVKELDALRLSKFRNHVKHFRCTAGLMFNFRAVKLDYRYIEV